MKSPYFSAIVALAAAVFLTQPAWAQQAQSPPAGTAEGQQAPPSQAELDRQYARMQEQMAKMQEEMAKIRQTQDPEERQKLLQEHWATMQEAMTQMHGMWGGMMMGGRAKGRGGMGGMMGGHMMGGPMMNWEDYRNLTPEQLKQRQYMMDRWMPMHQMMMEQMMQHQHWMMQQPGQAQTPEEKNK